MAKVQKVIICEQRKGHGSEESDPVRGVKQVWSTDGKLLFEFDPNAPTYDAVKGDWVYSIWIKIRKYEPRKDYPRTDDQLRSDDSPQIDDPNLESMLRQSLKASKLLKLKLDMAEQQLQWIDDIMKKLAVFFVNKTPQDAR